MKIDITYDDGVINSPFYSLIRQNVITNICNKLGEDFSDIKWIIFDVNNRRKNNAKKNLYAPFIVSQGEEYGFCYYEKREIWISTKVLHSSGFNNPISKYLTTGQKKSDLLADVILDELAHIKTGEDHGSKEYDDQLRLYHNRYYNRLY